ncbi:MAG: outer membrane protein assembly factor BamA [Burkholderiales bacterium]
MAVLRCPFAKLLLTLVLGLWGPLASAFEPFTVRDIRVVGLQRVDAGTVFGYLPVRIGETLTPEASSRAVRTLFATGLFNDVRLEVEGDVLVVALDERPAIASVDISGAKALPNEALLKGLSEMGLAQARIFDRALLERAEQEIRRQYLARGLYAARVTPTVTPLERNRVALSFDIQEGETARINEIRIVGSKAFSEEALLKEMSLSTPNWLSWYSKSDQYSREKLAADLESLRSFYLDRGYLEMSIDSTQVAIDADRERVTISINITEGERYRVTSIRLAGTTLGRDAELLNLLQLKEGEIYSGRKLSESTKAMSELFGGLGYAFANVNPVPETDREKRTVAFTLSIDPGRRVYVRRINISGNTRTRDEVIRRELRQFESAWYDGDRIRLSRERLGRLGYLENVTVDTIPVPDAPDQVDLSFNVSERPSGSFMVGVGVSSVDKLVFTANVNQQNFLGTGSTLGLGLNTGKTQRTIELRNVDPYFTADGVSRSIDVIYRTLNAQELGLGDYQLKTLSAALRFGIPYTEVDRISFGGVLEQNSLVLGPAAPVRFVDYVNTFGASTQALLGTVGWNRDGRDSPITPTKGLYTGVTLEATVPVLDLRFIRTDVVAQWYLPITRDYTLGLNAQFSKGWAFGGKEYPLFKRYYAGGIGSVRGFETSSLGPRDSNDFPTGGTGKFVASAEFLFPIPGLGKDQSARLFTFVDVGNVFEDRPEFSELRASAGLGLNWFSPIGPLKLSMGFPIRKEPTDRTQRFQFQIGTGF